MITDAELIAELYKRAATLREENMQGDRYAGGRAHDMEVVARYVERTGATTHAD